MVNLTRNITQNVLFITIVFLASFGVSYSQDIQFSQFYSAPLYLNPAFAGSSHHHRFISHNRWQWPNLQAKYNTYAFSYDTYINSMRSGLGIMAINDRQGSGSLSTTEIQGLYSYELHLHEKYTFRAGAQVGFGTKYLDFSDKTFTDQFTNNGYDANTPSGEELLNPRKNYLDVGLGGILYTPRAWFGISGHHVNKPNQSFTTSVSPLPTKIAFVGGYKIPLIHSKQMAYLEDAKDISITPTMIYKLQGKSDQLDVGLYGQYDQLLLGFWYRGLPTKKYKSDLQNNESVIAQIGWHFKDLGVGYSYDFVVSKLTGARPWGAHELNLTYIIQKHHKGVKPMKKLPCPHFYQGQ